MVILGIDPGLATMGYGVIETDGIRHKLIQYGALITQPKQAMPQRLRSIFIGVNQLMDLYNPQEVAMEELFFSKNVTTGIAVAQRTEEIYEYTPMQIKQAVTGQGKADKHQVQMMVRALLGIREVPKPDDAADALAVAITHAHSRGARALFKIQ